MIIISLMINNLFIYRLSTSPYMDIYPRYSIVAAFKKKVDAAAKLA